MVYAQDAQVTLDQAEMAASLMPLTDEQKKQFSVYMQKARSELRMAQQILMAATDACVAPDVFTAFAGFVAQWTAIEALLGKSVDPSGKLGAAPLVQAPEIVLASRRRVVQP
jgi:hypothetical protein